jgi:cytochrome P450
MAALCRRIASAGTERSCPYAERVKITDPAEVRAVLADPAALVPEAPATGEPGGLAWLRATVSRFSNGETHRRRRALACGELARIDPGELRRATRAGGAAVDALAAALGLSAPVARQVAIVARAYHPDTAGSAEADRAVASLVDAFGGVPDEATAVRISLLVQACDATAALAETAIAHTGNAPADDVVAAVLRDDPPVRATRRVIGGAVVTLDLTSARDTHLPFGSGPRRCPGREHALALAAGTLEAHCDGA